MYGITQVVSSANDAYRSQFNMPYMCMCIYAYMCTCMSHSIMKALKCKPLAHLFTMHKNNLERTWK